MATLRTAFAGPVKLPLIARHVLPPSVVPINPFDVDRTTAIFLSDHAIVTPVKRSPSVPFAATGGGRGDSGRTPGTMLNAETLAL